MSVHERPKLVAVAETEGRDDPVEAESTECIEGDVELCRKRILRTKNLLHVLDGLIGHVDATLERLEIVHETPNRS